ncbi:class I SAM-dependent methyltransferase [Haloterrigena sp. SYSU A558-1]|uniref:Class I SAM-dependent methyltransferase n=1 Tax=Haloterrigena gelatinilytica TaxID=2741724 RepID=A0ABX2LGJ0_9EURY|nr:class I SAM-dependent methyltransferase [Haloterrigena gelatinilytica]NUC74003.1 class I SAM-dependent methyltransferase [Haloterrigena gelatinilytica]
MTQPTRDDETVKDLVQQHWDGRAATFDEEPHHGIHTGEQRDRWLEVLRETIGDDPRRVLDAGCGTGVLSLLLAELGHDVTGVDFAPSMLERAREKARAAGQSVEFHRGDAEALAAPDDAFDLLTARHLVWTLPNPAAAIREWQRVVEPGGRILLVEGYWDHDEPWDEYEVIHDDLPLYDGRPPDELREVLLEVGLRDVTYEPLQDSTLWGREPRHDYYLMSGTVPR